MTGSRLGVDFGTSNTVAALRRPDGRVETLLFDGSPVLPSAVFAAADTGLLTGRDAIYSAGSAPERFEPNPKLRIDAGTLWLGAEVAVVDLFAAVLRRVGDEARHAAGGHLDGVILTHPAGWGTHRQSVLADAAARAGLGTVELLPEPVAAASFAAAANESPSGAPTLVYDLGAGTFDVSVVVDGRVIASDGLLGVGGLDIDAAIVDHIATVHRATDPAAWDRLTQPKTPDDRRAWRRFTDDVRTAKELLSRSSQTHVHLPGFDRDALIGRGELEQIARPFIARTIPVTRAALDAIGPGTPLRMFLVGGGSRLPLVATMLHRALDVAPVVGAQPELAVAQGALLHNVVPTTTSAPPIGEVAPPPWVAPPVFMGTAPSGPQRKPTVRALRLSALVLAVLALVLTAGALVASQLVLPSNVQATAALEHAKTAVVAVLSYDYRSFDASTANAAEHVTGEFAGSYQQSMAALKDQVIEEKAIVQTAVSSAGVVSESSDEVKVLLFVNQTRRSDIITGEQVDANRVEVTMVPADGTWKASAVKAL